jgi:hypothetical protein
MTDYQTEPLEPFSEPFSEPSPERATTSGVHPVNVLHLVMGVAFAGIVAIWALVEGGAVGASDLRWLLPIPWVAAGIAGLVATAPRLRGPRD